MQLNDKVGVANFRLEKKKIIVCKTVRLSLVSARYPLIFKNRNPSSCILYGESLHWEIMIQFAQKLMHGDKFLCVKCKIKVMKTYFTY